MNRFLLLTLLWLPFVSVADKLPSQKEYWDTTILCGGIFRKAYLESKTSNAKNLYGNYSFMMVYYSTMQIAREFEFSHKNFDEPIELNNKIELWNSEVKKKANWLDLNTNVLVTNIQRCTKLSNDIEKYRQRHHHNRMNRIIERPS